MPTKAAKINAEDKNKITSIPSADFLNIIQSTLKEFPNLNKDTFLDSAYDYSAEVQGKGLVFLE